MLDPYQKIKRLRHCMVAVVKTKQAPISHPVSFLFTQSTPFSLQMQIRISGFCFPESLLQSMSVHTLYPRSVSMRRYRILQRFFLLGIQHLKLQNNGIQLRTQRLQHHIIASQTALTIRSDRVAVGQLHHQPQHKPMIKAFRFRVSGRTFPSVKGVVAK